MFVMAGGVLLAITLIWVNGKQIRGATTKKYEVVLQFAMAQGITVGTSVRIRGVEVGNVVEVRPSLQRIDAVVELVDSGIVIPRNALVEVNQSGLVSETLIDITPRLPLPKPSLGPLDLGCSDEHQACTPG
jgi:ABC-type transporter Mla subunit MlaD